MALVVCSSVMIISGSLVFLRTFLRILLNSLVGFVDVAGVSVRIQCRVQNEMGRRTGQ